MYATQIHGDMDGVEWSGVDGTQVWIDIVMDDSVMIGLWMNHRIGHANDQQFGGLITIVGTVGDSVGVVAVFVGVLATVVEFACDHNHGCHGEWPTKRDTNHDIRDR